MAAHGLDPVQKQNVAFMTCILKVNTRSSTWQRTLMEVLNNVNGVSNFRMDEDGKVEVSGTVNPKQLLKMLAKAGKQAEVCWFQFGECSSNLYMPTPPPQTPNCYYNNYPQNAQNGYYDGSCYGYGDDWQLRYEGYGPKRSFPHLRLPSPYGSASNGNALDGKTSPKVITTTQSPTSGKGNSCCSLM